MDNIKNKTVLITGGACGLGFTYAHKMLQHGAKIVAILDLSTSPGEQSVATLEKEFGKGKAVFFPCDVTNTTHFAETFKKICSAWNGLDIVINNAGMFNDQKWEQTVHLNVRSLIHGTFLAMDHMGKHKGGKGGTLVNIASIVALQIFPSCPVYCASKHDVLAFSRCLQAQERYDKTGVRVLVMCPGVTTTTLLDDAATKILDFVEPAEVHAMLKALPTQPPEVVGEAMVSLIQKGKNGAVWVSEGGKPPYAVEFPPCRKVELNL